MDIDVWLSPSEWKNRDCGSECAYIAGVLRMKAPTGLKVYRTKKAAREASEFQGRAHKANLAPPVIGLGIVLVRVSGQKTARWGYFTAQASHVGKCPMAELAKLRARIDASNVWIFDVGGRNVGRYGGQWVCIDFGAISARR